MDCDLTSELLRRSAAWSYILAVLSSEIRVRAFNALILQAQIYVCEKRRTTKTQKEKLAVTQKATERQTCGISFEST